jgi:uncharacterized protein involved in response to NO
MQKPFEKHPLDYPFLGRGFRPFFLLAAIYGACGIIAWVGVMTGELAPLGPFLDPVLWHAHEMIYGFVMAVVAGFLLTAVANWTGGAPVRQFHLAALCLLWLAGRFAVHLGDWPLWLVATLDCLFIPALAISLSVPLIRSRNTRNFIFLGILLALLSCNIGFYYMQDRLPLHLALLVVITMISLVGGRIIPAFTVAAVRRTGQVIYQREQMSLDKLCLASMLLLMAAFACYGPDDILTGGVAGIAGILQLARFRHYHTRLILKDPMCWILHAGYLWLVAGLCMLGFHGFGVGPLSGALHALTAGSIGSMCIGMMCRVTLGHTGRHLISRPVTTIIFIVMQIAAIVRVFAPLLMPDHYLTWIAVSGVLWAASFGLYLPVYAPMLLQRRPDGLPA